MIVDTTPSHPAMANYDDSEAQQPPSYDVAVNGGHNISGPFIPEGEAPGKDVKVPSLPSPGASYPTVGPPPPHAASGHPATVVYNYVNPRTGERVVSLLPPDHPQMVCLQQGGHVTASKFGILGILAAIVWFPLGIGLCLLDRKVYCQRCGAVLDDGMC
ncbi:hypothetical protein GSI_01781 [Ganoderma sinense ZZ0214-1]|uniref:Uncharacterized protein n=1 Tax=Ganoderma sinense ZZ0214-1 TaxID=1077348 RepID=A0A2G8SQS1_9APHY|nr:hypothetical protein GSI_01781 [Ganoderma sinense ZZ0214-1]